MAPAANYIAYTAPINPSGASPVLTREHIWPLLQRKIRAGQDFVGGAITATDIVETYTNDSGQPVTVREVVFREGNRRVKEVCVEFRPMKVEFHQPDGSKVQNIISEGSGNYGAEDGKPNVGEEAGEDLWMTYTFEWLHPGDNEEDLKAKSVKERAMARTAVESTIKVMREMVVDGRWKQ